MQAVGRSGVTKWTTAGKRENKEGCTNGEKERAD